MQLCQKSIFASGFQYIPNPPGHYLHSFEQQSDTGLKLELLQKYIFVPLDIFGKIVHTNGIKNELEAWLMFLSTDDPDKIIRLITEYPEFKPLYEHIYDMCRNVERVMGMYSKELQIMDRNTVQYMVDQMQEEIDSQKELINTQAEQISTQNEQLASRDELISTQNEQLASRDELISTQNEQLASREELIAALRRENEALKKQFGKNE